MNKRIINICAALAALILAGCQEKIDTEILPVETTHSVTFTAEKILDTKTAIASEENGVVSYKWISDDEARMHIEEVYSDGETTVTNQGTVTNMALSNNDRTATFSVLFDGVAPAGEVNYKAVYAGQVSGSGGNPKIPDEQTPLQVSFDPNADVLISDAIVKTSGRETNPSSFMFNMNRVVSMNKMTLKGLTEGETITSVTFESDKNHTGYYSVSSGNLSQVGKRITLSYTANNTIPANGEFPVYFTTAPVTDATFSVTVVTNQKRYRKTSSKTITFEIGKVRRFGVDMTGCEQPEGRVFTLVTDPSDLSIGDEVVIAADGIKNKAMSIVQNNNNRGVTDATKSSDRSTITITEQVQVFTLVAGTQPNTYAFSFDVSGTTNYLYSASGGNYLRSKSTLENSGSWSITISNSDATVTEQGASKILRYNSSSDIFSCYNSGQQPVYIYHASARLDPGMSWSAETASATITSTGVSFNAPTLDLGHASNVTYASSNASVATISSDGEVTIVGEGEAIITASFAGDTNYAPANASYTLTVADNREAVANPTFDPAAGAVALNSTVTISCATSGATIHYTVDGTVPTAESPVYSSAITIDAAKTIKAIAVKDNYKNSEVVTAEYTIAPETATISQILADNTVTAEHTVRYEVSGVTVMAVQGKNYIIADATGVMLMYYNGSPALVVGSQYDVQGDVKLYNGVHEFSFPTVQSSTGTAPEYGTPEEMTVASLTQYATAPVTKYARLKMIAPESGYVGTDGTNSINVYDGTGTWADYYGKGVIVTGYLIGYYNPKINILATSIEEDPTTPTLSVTPASLTWESNEYGSSSAKTITVTLNGSASAGDYTISGSNSNWTVSKSGNTITVYPNAANTSTTTKSITLTIAHADDTSVYQTVTCTQASGGPVEHVATIYFNNTSSGTNINSTSVTGNDSESNEWTITTVGTTSFTPNAGYSQVGSSNKPAESITFTTTLPRSATNVSLRAKFGGFNGTSADISLKVGNTTIGSGRLKGTSDVTVTSSSSASGTVLTVTVTGIKKGVKAYWIEATYTN